MSDLNDLIATNAIRAFNQGVNHALTSAAPGSFKNLAFDAGRIYERERILRLAKEASISSDIGAFVYLFDLEDYIKFADKEDGVEIA